MNLEHVFSTLLLIISYKVANEKLGTSPPNVFNPINDTYTFVYSD